MKKCDAAGMCKLLAERVNEGWGGKGYRVMNTINLKDKVGSVRSRFAGVTYHTNAKDRGLLLNACPFCLGKPGYLLAEKES